MSGKALRAAETGLAYVSAAGVIAACALFLPPTLSVAASVRTGLLVAELALRPGGGRP